MVTRAKHGIFRPKIFLAGTVPLAGTLPVAPDSVHNALKSPDWTLAMKVEFQALVDNHT